MYISYGSTDPSIVRYFSKRVPRSLATTSGQFVIDSATVAACSLTSPSSSRPAKVKFPDLYALSLYRNPGATLDDLREAVSTLEETHGTARRVFGGAHPFVKVLERALQKSRAALRARETPPGTR